VEAFRRGPAGESEAPSHEGSELGNVGVATQFVNLRHYAGIGIDESRWLGLAAYLDRVEARPSFGVVIEVSARPSGSRDAEAVGCSISSLTGRGVAGYDRPAFAWHGVNALA
jgi:hypothetical protein